MRRPLLIGLILGGLALVALIVVGVVAAVGFADRQNAIAEHDAAADDLSAVVDEVGVAVAEADQVIGIAATDPLLPADAVTAVTTERDAAATALDDATALDGDVDGLGTDEIRDLTADIRTTVADLGDDDDLISGALGDLVLATQSAAADVDAANFDAENPARIAFRAAVAELEASSPGGIADALLGYLDAAHALEASHAEEIAEKAGPLFDARMAVEQFARSLGGGVLLDFDWAVIVNGYGTGGSYGGTSYWESADGGYATITLSDSVASMWAGAGVQALVAHEVGHAVLALERCNSLFFGSEFESAGEEPWATAWAISLGYTADGSGESIYGRPSDSLIALAAQCR